MERFWLACFAIIAVVCLVFGARVLVRSVGDLMDGFASVAWPTTSGTVLHARVAVILDAEGLDWYRPEIVYTYSVGPAQFEGKRPFVGGYRAWVTRSNADAVVSRYYPGETVLVYFNPARPGNSVLEPGPRWGSLIRTLFYSGVLLAVGAFLGWAVWTT